MHKRVFKKADGRVMFLYGNAPHTLPPLEEMEPAPTPQPHLRWHPLRREWVVYAAHRQNRTFLPPPEYDPLSPTKPGGFPTEIPFETFEIAVFPNRFPSLTPHPGPAPEKIPVPVAPAKGDCEVVVYTPEQTGSLATLPQERRELLVRVWADRYRELLAREEVRFVMPFENRGEEMGVTLHHPHGQIYAYPFVPPLIEKEVRSFREGEVLVSLLNDAAPYTVCEDEHTIAMIPPFARYPYEVLVYPKRFHPGPWTFSDLEFASFGKVLGQVVAKYDGLFDRPMPYIMLLHAAPKGEERTFHFHVEFYAALRARDKLKYLAGTEVGAGTFAVDALPEQTAKTLREVL
ncbi:MAG: galactose-1-phosphate uridylyltransferase [Meiothermus sp.]